MQHFLHCSTEHSSGDAFLWLAAPTPIHFVSYLSASRANLLSFMAPPLQLPGPYLMSVLHEVAPSAIVYLPQRGTPALPLRHWLNALKGWLTLAKFEMGGMLSDADRNHFLLGLLGDEGTCLLDWDVEMMETEVTTAMHANFRSAIHLHLQQPLNAPTMTSSTSGRPLPG